MGANHSSRFALAGLRYAFVPMAVVFLAAVMPQSGRAGTLQVLYNFCSQRDSQTGFCVDGASPLAAVVRDANGNFFGTTANGGTNNNGTVFELGSGGGETVLYNFCSEASCADGSQPLSALLFDTSGNLYGTAKSGGQYGAGVLFRLRLVRGQWTYAVLHDFCSTPCGDAGKPTAGLVMDKAGNLYGTTEAGGLGASGLNNGTVFRMTRNKKGNWKEQVLYAFCAKRSCADGAAPEASLIRDSNGNLYGTTENGGKHNSGTAFRLSFDSTKGKWREEVLHHFCSNGTSASPCKDGASPVGSLAMDSAGNLFGTTMQGGSGNPGSGVAFELVFNPSTGGYTYDVLHDFCRSYPTCTDGETPKAGPILDAVGNLYGTTYASGGQNSDGSVFRLSPAGNESVLARFCGNFCGDGVNNGASPEAPVIMDSSGNLYGTAFQGGAHQAGEVFEVTN